MMHPALKVLIAILTILLHFVVQIWIIFTSHFELFGSDTAFTVRALTLLVCTPVLAVYFILPRLSSENGWVYTAALAVALTAQILVLLIRPYEVQYDSGWGFAPPCHHNDQNPLFSDILSISIFLVALKVPGLFRTGNRPEDWLATAICFLGTFAIWLYVQFASLPDVPPQG